MRLKRHRGILTLVRAIKEHDTKLAMIFAGSRKGKLKNRTEDQEGFEANASEATNESVVTPEGTSVETIDHGVIIEHASSHSINPEAATPKETGPEVTEPSATIAEDAGKQSESIFGKGISTPMTRKQKKNARKLAANASRVLDAQIFTADDLAFVSEALYLKMDWGKSGDILADKEAGQQSKDTGPRLRAGDIEENQGISKDVRYNNRLHHTADKISTPKKGPRMVTRTNKFTNFRVKDSPGSPFTASDLILGLDPQIFQRLGVQVNHAAHDAKERRELVMKLAIAITEELDITEREDRETQLREEGFWRYVSKHTFEALTELHQRFSWSTGQIKKNKNQKTEVRAEDDQPAAHQASDVLPVEAIQSTDWTIDMVHDETYRIIKSIFAEHKLVKRDEVPVNISQFKTVLKEAEEDLSNLMLKKVAEECSCQIQLTYKNENNDLESALWTWPGCVEQIIERDRNTEREKLKQQVIESEAREEAHRQGRPYIKRYRVLRIV